MSIDTTLELLLREAAPLTEYAWKFRYPADAPEPRDPEARAAYDLARRVYEAVIDRLPDEVAK